MRASTRDNQEAPASLLRAMREDHAVLEQALNVLSASVQAEETTCMRMAFQRLEAELREHIEIEERTMLSRFARAHLADAARIRQEHAQILARLEHLGVALELHNLRVEMVDAFAALLRAHTTHEERVMYAWADTFLPRAQKHALFNWLLARFDERLQRHPG